ncbi:MAG TPA: NAD(P)/FAD-dependent oxidoreductase [Nannocystis sp.]
MRKPKVIVVGAGPSGGACALSLARTGQFELLVLDKSRYPRVKVCGSGLSPHALAMLDRLEVRQRFRPNHAVIDTLVVRSPTGEERHLVAGVQAWIVPRVELDHGIVQAAVELGAEFREGVKVVELLRDGAGVVRGVKSDAGEFEADLVVCADGSPSRFSTDPRPKTTIRTIMGWWRGTPWSGRAVHMFWDPRLSGYYAWMFPEPGGVVNIGLTIPETAPEAGRLKGLFQDLLDDYWADGLRDAEQVGKWMGHPAVITSRVGPIAEARAIWVGEAARLVSPGTVEGIGFALESGIVAADVIARHFTTARGLSPLACAGYRARVAASMLPKFWVGEAVARGSQIPLVRKLADRVVQGPAAAWLNRTISAVLGDNRHEVSSRAS